MVKTLSKDAQSDGPTIPELKSGAARGWEDIVKGTLSAPIWNTLALQEIQRRYRRSMIGPFWITLTMGVTVAGLGLLYAKLFKIPLEDYLPYLTIGFIIWGHISPAISEVGNAFISAGTIIKQSTIPYVLHIWKIISTNTIIFLHNIVIFFIVAFIFKVPFGIYWLLAILALLIINLTIFGVGLFLAILSTRFRDVPIIVSNVLLLAFFMTPILWQPTMLSGRSLFLRGNPFYYLIEIFRQPLLGTIPSLDLWIASLGIMSCAILIGGVTFVIYRKRIAYWL